MKVYLLYKSWWENDEFESQVVAVYLNGEKATDIAEAKNRDLHDIHSYAVEEMEVTL